MTRAAVLVALLELPPPAALPVERMGYRYMLPRDPRRDPEVLKRDLGTAYVAWRRQLWTGGDSVVSVRRQPTMRIVRRA
jgi:hypothetical protein